MASRQLHSSSLSRFFMGRPVRVRLWASRARRTPFQNRKFLDTSKQPPQMAAAAASAASIRVSILASFDFIPGNLPALLVSILLWD